MLKMPSVVPLVFILTALFLAACGSSDEPRIVTATPPDYLRAQAVRDDVALAPMTLNQDANDLTRTPVFVAPPEEIYTCFDVLGAATSRPRYTLDADFDWPSKSAEVTQTVRYTNLTDNPQERLVLHAEPNRYANGIQLAETRLNNTVIEGVSINITQMSIPLPEPLPPGCALELTLVYTLNVPPIEVGYYGRFGYLGYTSRQVNLGHWFPVVGLQRAGDWYTPRPYFVGEQTTAEMADFELRFTLQDAPPDVELAAAGDVVAEGDNQWTITLENARDLTLSLGDGFRRESVLATNDVVVELYHYPDVSAGIEFDAPRQALSAAADSMLLFEEQFGMDYPLERLVVVQGDFPDGMEFSGLIYVSEAWFRTWNGRLNSWLTTITVHEVAHQWWYLLVGNDPAEYPYMDEAFATYSEFLFYERFYENPDWWWDFRVRAHDVTAGAVDRSIYHFDNARGYINMAYLRGALMLHNLREELGDDAFFAWLQSYLRQHENRVATPDDLWGAMPEDALAETDATRRLYLQGAAALPTPIPDPTATPAD